MAITGPEDGDPYKVGVQVVDAATGLAIGQAILAALLQRTTTGVGAHLRLSLFEVATYVQSSAFAIASRFGQELDRPGNTAGALGAPTDLFRVADGFVMVVAYFPDQWKKLCTLLEVPEIHDDPRFATNAQSDRQQGRTQAGARPDVRGEGPGRVGGACSGEAGIIAAPVRSHLELVSDPRAARLRRLRQGRERHDGAALAAVHPLPVEHMGARRPRTARRGSARTPSNSWMSSVSAATRSAPSGRAHVVYAPIEGDRHEPPRLRQRRRVCRTGRRGPRKRRRSRHHAGHDRSVRSAHRQ